MDHGCTTTIVKFGGLALYLFGGVLVVELAAGYYAPDVGGFVGFVTIPIALALGYGALRVLATVALFRKFFGWLVGRLRKAPEEREPLEVEVETYGPYADRPHDMPAIDADRDGAYELLPWGVVAFFIVAQQPVIWIAASVTGLVSGTGFWEPFGVVSGVGLAWTSLGAIGARLGWVGMPE